MKREARSEAPPRDPKDLPEVITLEEILERQMAERGFLPRPNEPRIESGLYRKRQSAGK